MNYAHIGTEVKGLNRAGQEGEETGTCTPQELTLGMVSEYYTSENGVLTPKSQAEIDAVDAEHVKEANASKAEQAQTKLIATLAMNDTAVKYGLPPVMDIIQQYKAEDTINELQGEIANPTDDAAYEPDTPEIVIPDNNQLTIKVVREEGWQGAMGFRVTLLTADPAFTPGVLALAVYTSPECEGYLYTTGAFIETDGVWGAVCPAGQEPGEDAVNFGLLNGPTPIRCFTLAEGRDEMSVLAYEVV